MTTYILRRFLISILLVFLMTFVVFLIMNIGGNTYFDKMRRDPRVSKKQVQMLMREAGLDKPVIMQYLWWLRGVLLDVKIGNKRSYIVDFEDVDIEEAYAMQYNIATKSIDYGVKGFSLQLHFTGKSKDTEFIRLNQWDNPNPLTPFDFSFKYSDSKKEKIAKLWQEWWNKNKLNLSLWQAWWEYQNTGDRGQGTDINDEVKKAIKDLLSKDELTASTAYEFLSTIKRKSWNFWDPAEFDRLEFDLKNNEVKRANIKIIFYSFVGKEEKKVEKSIVLMPNEKKTVSFQLSDLSNSGLSLSTLSGIEIRSSEALFEIDNFRLKENKFPFSMGIPNFGFSYEHKKPVFTVMLTYVSNSILLTIFELIVTWGLAIALGIYCAVNQYKIADQLVSFLSFFGMAIPGFFFGVLVLYLVSLTYDIPQDSSFSFLRGIFPMGGKTSANYDTLPFYLKPLDILWHLFLPGMVISLSSIAGMQRVMRGNFLEELRQQYVLTARAKGLSNNVVLYKHILRNAIIPFVAGLGSLLPALLGGSAIIEIIFNYPGIGKIMLDAVRSYDMPLVMGDMVAAGLLLVIGNLIADILLGWVDPRISVS